MIVDDHTLIRETWSFLLGRNENFEVISEVGDGQEAIDIARDKRPNIVLLDINMSPLNGFDVLKMIRKLSRCIPNLLMPRRCFGLEPKGM